MVKHSQNLSLPTQPTNRIFTGVAGTGKTYHLLQLQRLYDTKIRINKGNVKQSVLASASWREVICAVLLLEDRTMSVAEINRHPLLQDKITANQRSRNISQTLWASLGAHSHPDSTTVNYTNRSANYYFDKDTDSRWYLLDEVKASLRKSLADLLSLYEIIKQDKRSDHQTKNVSGSATNDITSDFISRSCLVSFHQSYGYDEFVEGIRPQIDNKTGQMRYSVQAGAFLQLCRRAQADPEHRYAMLIDEINRANTAQVFGELMSIIEPDKRAGQPSAMQVMLAYSGRQISVPSNIDIYATMNTQDHSLTALDNAFRRRFEFVDMMPDSSDLPILYDNADEQVDLARLMQSINMRIANLLGQEAQLGQSYFYHIDSMAQLAKRFVRQILPQLIHNIEGLTAPMQRTAMLWHILYGERLTIIKNTPYLIDTLDEDGASISSYSYSDAVFQTQHHHSTADKQNSKPTPAIALLSLVSAMEQRSTEDEDGVHNDNDRLGSIYLTAAPYQMLYQANHRDPIHNQDHKNAS